MFVLRLNEVYTFSRTKSIVIFAKLIVKLLPSGEGSTYNEWDAL